MINANRQWLTVGEVAEILGLSRPRTYQLVSEGRIPAVRTGPRRIRVPRAALDEWLAAQAREALDNLRPIGGA